MKGETRIELIMAKLTDEEREHLREVIDIDDLTGVYNRRFFNHEIERQVHRAEHSNKDISLLLFDIDNFKQYQDRHPYKHIEGDRVLNIVAQCLKQKTHDYDIVARYGGEELAVICPDNNLEEGVKVAKRLVDYVSLSTPVTVSCGVANYKGNASGVVELIYKADKGLYQAKINGKNRVEVYRGE